MVYTQSSNPTLKTIEKVHFTQSTNKEYMTSSGAYNKTLFLILLVFITGFLGWNSAGLISIMPLFFITLGIGLVIALTLAFKPLWAPVLAPIYALTQGFFFGVISVLFETAFQGIVIQAILLTLIIALSMNLLYRSGLVTVTKKFRSVVILGMFSVFGIYMISILLSTFGSGPIPMIHESGPIGIIFSLAVITIATLMLLVDYDFIDRKAKQNLPKKMEWYGAFALIVTLLWLYLEILKLLSKLKDQ